ncbi:MAG: hypothetical protein R2910_10420 [Gemmatimonadales bacterium]
MPDALVRTGVVGAMDPPPTVKAKVMATPATGLPFASVTSTDGGAATGRPAVSLWLVTELAAMDVAPAELTVNPALVALVRPVAEATRVWGVAKRLVEGQRPNVATPVTAFAVRVPLSVLVPGLAPIATVTAFTAVVTVLPAPSGLAR